MPLKPTADQRRTVEKLSGLGVPQAAIATVLDVDEKTLRKHLRAELDSGMTKANTAVAEFLFDAASGKRGEGGPAITAAIFWAKTRLGWKETSVTEHTGRVEMREKTTEEKAAEAKRILDEAFGVAMGGNAEP